MPQVLQLYAQNNADIASEDPALKQIFDEAYSEFERFINAKRAIFERYLETRVNWLRMQLTREAESTNSLDMNHLDFLRLFKPDSLPEVHISTFHVFLIFSKKTIVLYRAYLIRYVCVIINIFLLYTI